MRRREIGEEKGLLGRRALPNRIRRKYFLMGRRQSLSGSSFGVGLEECSPV